MKDQRPELLSPAGSMASLKAAVEAGADAVYAGGMRFGARAGACNLREEEVKEAIDYVHLHGRKFYLTVNTLLKEQEMGELFNYLLPYYEQGLDAVIVQDVGVFSFVRRQFPDLPVHISTQMTITGADGVSFFAERGARRIILARELSLQEIQDIRAEADTLAEDTAPELECFVHGALCYCYSGQCLLSSMIGGRSGNRGLCAGPCRLAYTASRAEKDIPSPEPETLLSLKDLCTITDLPALTEAGIDAFKIEGRMKQPDYVYTVTALYRKYLDLYLKLKETGREKDWKVSRADLKTLQAAYRRRGYTDGYYFRSNGREMVSFDRPQTDSPAGAAPVPSSEKCENKATQLQEKINGKLMLSAGRRAKLVLECGKTSVTCEGAVVQEARQQPLTAGQVEKQIRKTGQTPFAFQELTMDISGPVFLPVGDLNALRREGLSRLQDKLLEGYRRSPILKEQDRGPAPVSIPADDRGEKRPRRSLKISVLVSTVEQLEGAISVPAVARIYVDAGIWFSQEVTDLIMDCTAQIFLALPYVFREKTRRIFAALYESILTWYDGVLIRNWDEFAWLKRQEYPGPVLSDQNLYVFNRESAAFLTQAGIDSWTAPAELNARELKELGIKGQSLVVYGYQPVMISAGCIRKTTAGCSRGKRAGDAGEWMTLTDETRHVFQVKMVCPYCYNLIYNSVPLFLLDEQEEIRRLDPEFLRLDFTAETREQTQEMIKNCADGSCQPGPCYTRGHFRRGVI